MDEEARKPMQKNTIFRIRSMTKPFIATATLMLVDEGKINLSDSVSKYLPSFNNEASVSVTIEQLLTHTGGFAQPGFPRDYENYHSLREAADDIGIIGPEFTPGTKYIYSDAGVAVLGAVIAEIVKMPVEDYLELKILRPLEMTSTYFMLEENQAIKDRISGTYYRSGTDYVKYWDSSKPQLVNYFRASGGIYSTPLDYAKFLYMWMNGGSINSRQYLSKQSITRALTPGDLNNQYGYLWELDQSFGHGGSDGTIGFVLPEKNLIVLYFTQSRATYTTEVIKAMVLKEFGAEEFHQYTRVEVGADYFIPYTGKYKNSQVELIVDSDDENLLVKTADSTNQLFFPSSAKDFFFHEILDIQLLFLRDSAEEVTGLLIYQRGENIEVPKIKSISK